MVELGVHCIVHYVQYRDLWNENFRFDAHHNLLCPTCMKRSLGLHPMQRAGPVQLGSNFVSSVRIERDVCALADNS